MHNEERWAEEIEILNAIVRKVNLVPAVKWGGTVYTLNGKNIVSLGGFKEYFCLWFHNGVFLKDPYKVLVNAQEGKTKALRQWRFTDKSQVNEKQILEYVKEAIQNQKDGKVWKPEKTTMPSLPDALQNIFEKDETIKKAFYSLAPYRQKEYIEYIDTAKQDKTKLSRIEKIVPLIASGLGLNDHYKK